MNLVCNILSFAEVVDRVRHKQHPHHFGGASGIRDGHLGVQFLVHVEQGLVVKNASCCLVAVCEDDGCPFVTGQSFASERPSGTYDEVTGHAQFFRFIESHSQHVDPFVAEPDKGLLPDNVFLFPGEGNRIDFHAGDTRFFEQIKFAPDFSLVYTVSVPPPADIGPVGIGRILECLPDRF